MSMRPLRRAIAVGLTPMVVVLALAFSVPKALEAPSDRLEIRIHHSRFVPAHFEVAAGSTVTFVIRNDDPIAHEFILGDDTVQFRHELGTEPHHGTVPGEVSIPAGQVASTSYHFSSGGSQLLARKSLTMAWAATPPEPPFLSSGGSQLLARKSLPMAWAATPPEPPFESPGSLIFGCHLPGHYTYGMKGTIAVRPSLL